MTYDTSRSDEKRTDTGGGLDRRRFIELTGTGAAATAMAGCLPDPDDDGNGPEGTQTGPTETPDGPPEGNVKIGHMAPLSGAAQFVGTGSSRSAQLAIDRLNEEGGIMDREVELVEADTQGSPNAAQGAVEELVTEEEVDVIVGTYVSEVTQAILDYTADFGVPFIVSGSAGPTTVTDFIADDYERYKNFFRVGPINSDFQAEAHLNYADFLSARYGFDSFGFVADRATWTEPFSETLPSALEEKGYSVDYNNRISIETNNFTPVLDDIQESGVDVVFRYFAHIDGTPIMREWHRRELDFTIEGIHVTSQLPEYPALSEGNSRYETTSQSAAGGVAEITEETKPFVEAYQERFGDEGPPGAHPMYMGFSTYDSMLFYKGAVESAGTWDYENFLDNIIEAMLSQEMAGTAGNISLYGPDAEYPHDAKEERDSSGVIQNNPFTQWQGENGAQLECVWPQVYSTADHTLPPWMQ